MTLAFEQRSEGVKYMRTTLENEKLVIVPSPDAQDNEAADDSSSKEHRLWRSRSPGELVVFETPFREGRHFAKKPGEFVPLFKRSKSCTKTVSCMVTYGASTLSSARTKEKAGSLTLILAGKYNQQLFPRGYKLSR
jgi:hypothetical protein